MTHSDSRVTRSRVETSTWSGRGGTSRSVELRRRAQPATLVHSARMLRATLPHRRGLHFTSFHTSPAVVA